MKTHLNFQRRLAIIGCFALLTPLLTACPSSSQEDSQSTLKESSTTVAQQSAPNNDSPSYWNPPESYPTDPVRAQRVKYGEQLVAKTHTYLSPSAADPELRLAGNHLACKNCHLENGKAPHAMGFIGIDHRYPTYYAPLNREVTLSERIEACFQRSLNGKTLPVKEQEALTDYLVWLGEAIPEGVPLPLPEAGLPELNIDNATAKGDPNAGQPLYDYHCAACHGKTGLGLAADANDLAKGYTFPPMWGPDSHSKRSSMADTLTAARYIHKNMPLGRPLLTTPQALDITAYINAQERPE